MAEETITRIADSSPEEVALKLLQLVMATEGKSTNPIAVKNSSGQTKLADRAYILDSYAECLKAVRAPRYRGTVDPSED